VPGSESVSLAPGLELAQDGLDRPAGVGQEAIVARGVLAVTAAGDPGQEPAVWVARSPLVEVIFDN